MRNNKLLSTECCQPDQLEAFLSSQIAPRQEQLLSAHLEMCEPCRRRLDELAAAPATWTQATAFLKDDPFDRAGISSEISSGIRNGSESESESESGLAGSNDEAPLLQPQIQNVLDMLNATDDPNMLGRLGPYEVSGVVGSGGMGIVLKAFDRPLDRTVAIKVMAPYLATSGAARQRFSREARAAAAVIHPNVIAIYGVSADATLPYLVMPYVGGASLQKRLDNKDTLPVADVLRIGIQISAGLAAAHDQGLVHRDIKPANILLDQGVDRLVITDFGLARAVDDATVTRTGVIAGTPQYMSPEQARGEPVDARSDLFSLGSVLYAACTGRVPFRADTPFGVLRRITDNAARPIQEINSQIPAWLCRIIDRLHAKSVAERFQSAEEVAQLLTQCLAHFTQPAGHALPSELRESRRSVFKSTVFRFGSVSAAVALVIMFAWWAIPKSPEIEQATSTPTPAPALPNDEEISRPWDSAETMTQWSDNLTPVFQHIESSLMNSSSRSRPISPTPGPGEAKDL